MDVNQDKEYLTILAKKLMNRASPSKEDAKETEELGSKTDAAVPGPAATAHMDAMMTDASPITQKENQRPQYALEDTKAHKKPLHHARSNAALLQPPVSEDEPSTKKHKTSGIEKSVRVNTASNTLIEGAPVTATSSTMIEPLVPHQAAATIPVRPYKWTPIPRMESSTDLTKTSPRKKIPGPGEHVISFPLRPKTKTTSAASNTMPAARMFDPSTGFFDHPNEVIEQSAAIHSQRAAIRAKMQEQVTVTPIAHQPAAATHEPAIVTHPPATVTQEQATAIRALLAANHELSIASQKLSKGSVETEKRVAELEKETAKLLKLNAETKEGIFQLNRQLDFIIQGQEKRQFLGTSSAKVPFQVNVVCGNETFQVQADATKSIAELIRRARIAHNLPPDASPNPRITFQGQEAGHGMTLGELDVKPNATLKFTYGEK